MISLKTTLIIVLVYISSIHVPVSCTKITWKENPNAPEAAKVPRSQKYWDENNIERPDYAKTDAELLKERMMKSGGGTGAGAGADGSKSDSMGIRKMVVMVLFFVGVWYAMFRVGMGGAGNKLGSSSSKKEPFSFVRPPRLGAGLSLEEKARLARLERFGNKETKIE